MIFRIKTMKTIKRLLPLLLLASCTLHQEERLQEFLAPPKKASALRNQHIALDALAYDPTSASLSVEEMDAHTLTHISGLYALQAEDLPTEERLLLASYDPLKDNATVHLEFQILNDHTLEIFQSHEIVSEAPLVLKNLLKGQEIELAFISKEKRTCTKMRFTPSPIRLTENGAAYSLQTIHRKGTHFRLHGRGLSPNESLILREQSGEVIREHTIQADEEGRFTHPIEPTVLGHLGGYATIDILREGFGESHLDYAWGGKLEAESREAPFHPLVFAVERTSKEIDMLALLPRIQKMLTIS